jgi:hypothetical protein
MTIQRDNEFSDSEDEADEGQNRRNRISHKRPKLNVPVNGNSKSQSPVPAVPESASVVLSEIAALVNAQPSLADRTTTSSGNSEGSVPPATRDVGQDVEMAAPSPNAADVAIATRPADPAVAASEPLRYPLTVADPDVPAAAAAPPRGASAEAGDRPEDESRETEIGSSNVINLL